MPQDETKIPNIFAYRGRHLLSAYHKQNKPSIPKWELPDITKYLKNKDPSPDCPICIIGAGAAGLYTAMILESLGLSYQIVDAGTKKRVGGRMFTYKFSNGGAYDYFDVGAMRFPDTPFMARTFDLARNRGLDVTLIPWIQQMVDPPNTWLLYNNSRVSNQDSSVTGDPFNVGAYVEDQTLTTPDGVHKKVREVLQPFRDMFRPPSSGEPAPKIATAIENLFSATDKFSMRTYMLNGEPGMDPKDVNWCETVEDPTGWYDRSLTQTVIEDLAFDWPVTPLPDPEAPQDPNDGWYCFDGGTSALPRAMLASLPKVPRDSTLFETSVTAISCNAEKDAMNVTYTDNNGEKSSYEYAAVISTVPIPRLGLIDLNGTGINDIYAQWGAIRMLQYGPAVKIGIRFSTAWWEFLDEPIHGGQSCTDLSPCNIAYPSYPEGAEPKDMSPVLILKYTRIEDAQRIGGLIHADGTAEQELIDVLFRDLAAVHGLEVEDITKYYTEGDYFAWDWTHDPLTMGGYAFFGPGVYGNKNLYSALLLPAANGKLFFAGEAASACPAWVAGALNSAWRAVDQYLALNYPESDQQKDFWKEWGKTEYLDEESDDELVDLNHKLAERLLVTALYKGGFKLEPSRTVQVPSV